MDKKAIKTFAIQARRDLIKSIRLKMENLGITETGVEEKSAASTNEIEYYGDKGLFISGQDIKRRRDLVSRLKTMAKQEEWRDAFSDLIEEVAYTWFNRIIAIRFMEVNDYLPSDVRVLSSETKLKVPDILREAFNIEDELGGYSSDERAIIQKALDTEEPSDMDAAYVILFTKQANALNQYLPELFEKTDDFMQLLFTPSYSVGVIRDLVDDIREDDFDVDKGGQVEIIGWLYQYYNTEPKETAVASPKSHKFRGREIASATQIFTPDWIVKYMVQNSLGKYWIQVLKARGDDRDESKIAMAYGWQYYMVDAPQSDEVNIKIENLNARLKETDVQEIRFLDPAMGSGHILVYAYELFMDIYKSEGFSQREAATSIIQKNLYGLEIDERAFQLAYFAITMCFRKYNRRALNQDVPANLKVFNLNLPSTGQLSLAKDYVSKGSFSELSSLFSTFQHATETGSLMQLNKAQEEALDQIVSNLSKGETPIYLHGLTQMLSNVLQVANILKSKWNVIVTNPPYMGSARMNKYLSSYIDKNYRAGKSDLFSAFMDRFYNQVTPEGYCAMVTMQSWMFLKSFEALRVEFLNSHTISNLMHMENGVMGIAFGTAVTIARGQKIDDFVGTYHQIKTQDASNKVPASLPIHGNRFNRTKQTNFEKIPGNPIAYWAPKKFFKIFLDNPNIGKFGNSRNGLQPKKSSEFVRQWFEVIFSNINFGALSIQDTLNSSEKWVPYNKGGAFRKWYGNYDFVVNWFHNGQAIRAITRNGKPYAVIPSQKYYFKESLTWPKITSGKISARYREPGSIPADAGNSTFFDDSSFLFYVMAIINSPVGYYVLNLINPTLNLQTSDFSVFPIIINSKIRINSIVNENINLCKVDWNSFESSWSFNILPLLAYIAEHHRNWTVEAAFNQWKEEADKRFKQLKANEEELNRIFIDLYGLQDELAPEEEDKDVSVRRADLSRDIKAFMSYFVGCVFGRYSIDTPGLAYAGGDWDDSKYKTFLPNEDDVIVLTDDDYFGDNRDVVNRFKEFLSATFGAEHLDENMQFIVVALGKRGSSSEEIIRAYLRDNFFKKDHLSTYQKRPIYWELNSGRNGGFKALMYLHRYDKNTMAMIRTKYLHPLQEAYERRLDQLKSFEANEQQTRQRNAIKKQITTITKQLDELVKYDEKLQHVANLHIDLDLDDGVLVNHAKAQADTKIFTPLK
ncbi:BREX-1 system adenine-specific DNA-methyltransferase PglX [Lacticaseibacillus rhamnosus]|uniref:site-specific DNA-methyltransferase (adenine-specific) n=2 Tax=Lacticaseibacillus rhamnosus TaxID=47715 RepID=A0AB33XUP6_LACRH|nr:BREX-1 system adenine-specific DNA-methyltransferase PglX [Lacticaseibacillus rhamnosus]EKS50910.1 putative type II restriction enzyme methylase subunit [Lacticaseibacillus rhamnosus LRHMDP3]EKS53308.1 putative type II restriction enzyme methylase subunit [Lacticaseibacillus rhamnosus LRHMDP2]